MTADQAMLFIGTIQERLSIISLDSHEYAEAVAKWSRLEIVGGSIYDALLASCAIKARAETIYSWNLRHHRQLGPDVEARLSRPGGK